MATDDLDALGGAILDRALRSWRFSGLVSIVTDSLKETQHWMGENEGFEAWNDAEPFNHKDLRGTGQQYRVVESFKVKLDMKEN